MGDAVERMDEFMRVKPRALLVAQQRRQGERELWRMRRQMSDKKRKDTLFRAAMPRTKHTRPRGKRRGRPCIMYPPVQQRHGEMEENFAMMREDKYGVDTDWEDSYCSNYMAWQERRAVALRDAGEQDDFDERQQLRRQERREAAALQEAHKAKMREVFETIATEVPHASGCKLVEEPAVFSSISGYFERKTGRFRDRVQRVFDRFYHERVAVAEQEDISEWPEFDDDFNEASDQKRRCTTLERRCPECDMEQIAEEATGYLVCMHCGLSVKGGEGVGYRQSFAEAQASVRAAAPYDRLAHFKEFIARLEGSERTEIPEIITNLLLRHCAMYRIDPIREPHKITYTFVRQCLKKTGYAHFFENISQIISRLTNQSPPRFSQEQREKLTMIFREVQQPFERNKGTRKNFLSYSYTTYKSCELLGYTEFLQYLPLLKAPQNLIQADEIWKKICEECKYEFVRTI